MFLQRRIQTARHGCMAFAFIPCVLLSVLPATAQQMARTDSPTRPQVVESYGRLPLSFEANQGQTDPRVKFLSRGPGYSLFLTGDSAVLSLHGQKAAAAVLRMKLQGANARASVAGADGLPGKSNYFVGNDPKKWHANVPTYGAVKYSDVYPGIDLVYHGNQRLLEYDFAVSPGADPRLIDLRFRGARKLSVNDDGALVIGLGGSEVIEHAPVVYQEISGVRKTLAGRYVMRGKGRVGFSVAEYDRSRALVIDPTLVYSTYLGGSDYDSAAAIAVDASGNAYVTGTTESLDFPTTAGAFQTTISGNGTFRRSGTFVSKLKAFGSALVYSTYLSASACGIDEGLGVRGIAVDTLGNAYVVGGTRCTDFPTTPRAFRTTYGGGNGWEASFVSKLNPTGSALVYSTYLGGNNGADALGIAVDADGNAYVTGGTASSDFPITPGAFQSTFVPSNGSGGLQTTYVIKLNASGSAPVYSTYLGEDCFSSGIAVDATGDAYITGSAFSNNFPTTLGAFQTKSTVTSVFVSKLNAFGSGLIYSTYVGGTNGPSQPSSIAVDSWGNAYITGYTNARDYQTTPGAFQTGYGNAFVTKLNAAGSGLVYSTYLGPPLYTGVSGIAVDAFGSAYVTGLASFGFPTTPDALQTTGSGAFLSKLNATGSALLYSTFLGASQGFGVAIDASGNAYVTGFTGSGLPTTLGAFQTTYGGASDAFVTKLSLGPSIPAPVTAASVNGPAGNTGWFLGAVTVTLSATAGASPVSATYYSVDKGPYQGYGAPFQIASDGTHLLLFYSVDTAGNQENPHGQMVNIDSTPPVSRVAALVATATSPNFSVQWSGTDATSGLRDYTIYVSDNGGPFTPWLTQTTATQAWFVGYLTHTYRFYCIARDNAGNVEIKTVADATTFVPQMEGDVNGDGMINCVDIELVKASFGTKTGQPGFNPAADVNKDGVVNVLDLAIVSQKLIPGTKCK